MKTILVVDDDLHIGNMVEEVLTKESYTVLRAYSGTEAVLLLSQKIPDLVLLDLMLPGLAGEEVLPKMKGIPVIIVSAKVDVDHKVELLLGGAVDYITKPFHTKELLARIAVQLREDKVTSPETILVFEEIKMNIETHQVTVADREAKLTRTEYAILKMLLQNINQVVTKSLLLDRIAEDTPDCTESSLKMHVSNLRKTLKKYDYHIYLQTLRNVGYMWSEKI